MLVSEWLQIRSMHGILINYFTLWTTLGDLEKTIYIDIHGKSCAQWASTEETTHSTTHVQPHKMTKNNRYINENHKDLKMATENLNATVA